MVELVDTVDSKSAALVVCRFDSGPRYHQILLRGSSSGVEHNLAKVGVAGSNPVSRSIFCFQNQILTVILELLDTILHMSSKTIITLMATMFAIVVTDASTISFPRGKNYMPIIESAEKRADAAARRVLAQARKMVEDKEIIRGSCWNWMDTAYTRAGFPKNRRIVIYNSTKKGPYVDLARLRPGDWIYHINYSYNGIEHSGMFIGWTNRRKKTALMLSYGGEGRKKPGRYREYDLRSVYHVTRAGNGEKKRLSAAATKKKRDDSEKARWLSIEEYARKYGYTYSETLKKARAGKLETKLKKIGGRKYTYILDRGIADAQLRGDAGLKDTEDRYEKIQKDIQRLEKEISRLKQEFLMLKKDTISKKKARRK